MEPASATGWYNPSRQPACGGRSESDRGWLARLLATLHLRPWLHGVDSPRSTVRRREDSSSPCHLPRPARLSVFLPRRHLFQNTSPDLLCVRLKASEMPEPVRLATGHRCHLLGQFRVAGWLLSRRLSRKTPIRGDQAGARCYSTREASSR